VYNCVVPRNVFRYRRQGRINTSTSQKRSGSKWQAEFECAVCQQTDPRILDLNAVCSATLLHAVWHCAWRRRQCRRLLHTGGTTTVCSRAKAACFVVSRGVFLLSESETSDACYYTEEIFWVGPHMIRIFIGPIRGIELISSLLCLLLGRDYAVRSPPEPLKKASTNRSSSFPSKGVPHHQNVDGNIRVITRTQIPVAPWWRVW
jgi:hypothetical protein